MCSGQSGDGEASAGCGSTGEQAPEPVYVSAAGLPAQGLPPPATLGIVEALNPPLCVWSEVVDPASGATEPRYQCGEGPAPPPGDPAVAARAAALRLVARGGQVGATPSGRGLVNLDTYFWLTGVGARDTGPVTEDGFDLRIRAFPEQVWWDFGDGARDGYGLGSPGRGSSVHHSYRRLGRYTVRAWIGWRVEFSADGRVVKLPGAFQTSLARTVEVDELRTVLTG